MFVMKKVGGLSLRSMEGAARFGIVAGAASPVAGQRSNCPAHRKDQKQLAAGNARPPGAERAQRWNNCGGCHSRRPHDCLGHWTGFLHRGLLRLHTKEGEMLEHPTHAGGVAFRSARSSDGVEGEANAEKA